MNKKWKSGKKWLYTSSALAILVGGGIAVSQTSPITQLFQVVVVKADELSDTGAVTIGTANGKPVVKTPNNDMSSEKFSDVVRAVVGDKANSVKYVANNLAWQSNTTIDGTRSVPTTGIGYFMRQDGFSGAQALKMDEGQSILIKNMGSVKDMSDNVIPIDVKLTLNSYNPIDNASNTALPKTGLMVALQGQASDGTLQIDVGVPFEGATGGPGEGETGSGGGTGSGGVGWWNTSGVAQLDQVTFSYTLINHNTGAEIDSVLQATRYSDIDSSQRVSYDTLGLQGIILSSNTQITLDNGVLVGPSTTTNETDGKILGAKSLIKVSTNTTNVVKYDGENQKSTIALGIFGRTDIKVVLDGTFKLDKSLLGYDDAMPNNLYSFLPLVFDIYDKDGKDVGDIAIPVNGSAVESPKLKPGEYTLKERASSVTSVTGQTHNPKTYKVTVVAGKKGDAVPVIKVENKPVMGEITVTKKGVESGDKMWNENYTLVDNELRLTSLTDGKIYTAKTDKAGKLAFKNLPLGKYKLDETKASAGFVNTFKPIEVTLTWQDNQTEIVYGTAQGTNQEVKGENKLWKSDKATGKKAQGKSEMKTAEYGLFYGDDSDGSSPHKKGDPVKWSAMPKAKLISGEKVIESVINGRVVKHGDNIVVGVDDTKLTVYIGNLPLGKYIWKELNAPVGYALDSSEIPFEIKKQDDQTANVITSDTHSKEQVIKAKLIIQKLVEIAGESAESGFNGVKFNIAPLAGTDAAAQTITTGIKGDEDGYASTELVYGDYVITEDMATLPNGYQPIRPIYIHMITDPKTDIITITASYQPDGSKPFSKRVFSQSDNQTTDKNDNISGSLAGIVSDGVPFISLSKITLTDKGATPVPSIDIEKTNGEITQNGSGNYADNDDNLGKDDHDTKASAFEVTGDSTKIYFKTTNNGEDDLTNIKIVDKTITGTKKVKDIKFTYKNKVLTADKFGVLLFDGKPLVLKVGETIEGMGVLEKLVGGEDHADVVEVTALGLESKREVGDKDAWHGHKPKPSVDIEKANSEIVKGGAGNHKDKADNIGKDDHDTKATALAILGDSPKIFFKVTNNGEDDLTDLSVVDKTTEGKKQVKAINWTYKDKEVLRDKAGIFCFDGKPLVLKVGETLEAIGMLEKLDEGEIHADKVEVVGVGVKTKEKVGDDDEWHAFKPKPSVDIEKSSETISKAGVGNNLDKADNLGRGDADTLQTAVSLDDKTQLINFRLTNNGTEPLTHIKIKDKTIEGKQEVKNLKWLYQGKLLEINKDGELTLNGKDFDLPVGGYITGTGILEKLSSGETHADEVTVSATGKISEKTVGDKDKWYTKRPQPVKPIVKIFLPKTGEEKARLATIIGVFVVAVIGAAKHQWIVKEIMAIKNKFKK
ncbi:collagen binding domain-containing protein [Lactococcus raffinolactis]|uniref:MSCRAMM family protein n=1 Tax=Pseudolactococcus raffinolactis TaxID=1366 RepID=UPI0034CD66BB